jgi:subtilase family serine protease
MKVNSRLVFCILACAPGVAPAPSDFARSLITQRVDEAKLTALRGNTHLLARPEFDRGAAPASLPMERMLLVLKRTVEQEAALEKLMDEQLDSASPNYHKWLTPEEFGATFGPSDRDIRAITGWLASHGFEDVHISAGRTTVEFSGNAGQVERAFHTAIHRYAVNGKESWANATDPLIPAALASAVAGVSTLHSFPHRIGTHLSHSISRWAEPRPQTNIPSPCEGSGLQAGGECFGISPYDFAAIYNVLPLWQAGIDGSGQSIGIVAQSNINIQDARNFRKLFGLPLNDPVIIVNGRDPGLTNNPQPVETEAIADVEWAGGIAPGATIYLVVSASTNSTPGFDLSAQYIVNHNLAPVLGASYGICDSQLGSSLTQFYNSLWQQAAAQGITVLMGTGDSGSACGDAAFATAPSPANHGLDAMGSAATPYNVAVGGTDFNDYAAPGKYWSSSGDPVTLRSALSYILETTWNDTCTNAALGAASGFNAEANCNSTSQFGYVRTTGGGGGKSSHFEKPAWQVAPGVPNDGRRDVPDISVFAGSEVTGHFYLFCEADREAQIPGAACDASGGPLNHFFGGNGVSISLQALAGVMALVNQYTGSRQGNANTVFYRLAAGQSGLDCNASSAPSAACIFHDITAGTNAMPCAKGSSDCITLNSANRYGVLAGYDAGQGGSTDGCTHSP